jgi:predicted lipoprotein with Yx(FWY)xxD motif
MHDPEMPLDLIRGWKPVSEKIMRNQNASANRFNLKRLRSSAASRSGEDCMRILIGALAGGIVCLLGVVALAQTKEPTSADTSKGKALVDLNGMTLYIFDRDSPGKSNCNAQCAVNWPPLIVDTDAKASGSFSFINRDDGRKQWAYLGKPLYTWSKDKQPGDATGDGVNSVWHVAAP